MFTCVFFTVNNTAELGYAGVKRNHTGFYGSFLQPLQEWHGTSKKHI